MPGLRMRDYPEKKGLALVKPVLSLQSSAFVPVWPSAIT